MSRRIAFLTMAQRGDYVIDDQLAIDELKRRSIDVSEVVWTSGAAWHQFEAVIVRTTWDYQNHLDTFLEVLGDIERSGTRLANTLPLIRWNAKKIYLRELQTRGVTIVPSQWGSGLTAGQFDQLAHGFGRDEWVIKPVVSANAQDTWRLKGTALAQRNEVVACFAQREWVVQPMIHSVLTEGEFSVFYFQGRLSHAIQKQPAAGDFRVQEEHGGLISPLKVDAQLRQVADSVMKALGQTPFQARVDVVRLVDGSLGLMELEAIEPSLYFRTESKAAVNFADAVEALLTL